MTQVFSSRKAARNRIPYRVLSNAKGGDIDAVKVIQRHFDPFMRRIATLSVLGTSYLNTELYDRLKTRLIMETMKFRL